MGNFILPEQLVESYPSRFEITKTYEDGSLDMRDNQNGYVIFYDPNSDGYGYGGYYATDQYGNEIYHIELDGYTWINLNNLNINIPSETNLNPNDFSSNMTIKCWDYDNDNGIPSEYTLSNGKIVKRTGYNIDGSVAYTDYYNNDCSFKRETSDGQIIICDLDGKEKMKFLADGTYYINGSDEKGTYTIDKDGNIVCTDQDGIIKYYNSKGEVYKYINKDGAVVEVDVSNQSQTVTKNGKTRTSMINHIEYDEEAYDKILRAFNSVDASYKGAIQSACSAIESAVNSFPDPCSCDVSGVESSIEGNISLINSLSEMTNYALLAYQACDEELKDGLYSLIDSLFDDDESTLAEHFKANINGTIEEKDGILEYKDDTDFSNLSDKVIASSIHVDEDGNKWYLNKYGFVIGTDGKNLRINYGGENFHVEDKNGVIVLKDSKNNDFDIFGDYNVESGQYGGNQDVLSDGVNGEPYISDLLKRLYPNDSEQDLYALRSSATDCGCGHTAITNLVFKKFQGNEEEFKKTFGYNMYDLKLSGGELTVDCNYEPLIMELFCSTNNSTNQDGVLSSRTTSWNSHGTNVKTRDGMEKYLDDKYGVTLDNLPEKYTYVGERGYRLLNLDGTIHTPNGGAHAMIITEYTDDGRAIVSSWGKKLILKISKKEENIKYGKSHRKVYK